MNIPHLYDELPNADLDLSQLSLRDLIEFLLRHIISLKSFVYPLFILHKTNAVKNGLVDVGCLNQLVLAYIDFNLVGANVQRDCFKSEIQQFEMTFSIWKESSLLAQRELLIVEVVHVLQEVDDEFGIPVGDPILRRLRISLLIFDN